jgi:hypothetical protein
VSVVLSALAVYNVNTLYFNARSFPEKSARTGNLSTIKTQCPNQLSCSRMKFNVKMEEKKIFVHHSGTLDLAFGRNGTENNQCTADFENFGYYFLFLGKLLYGPFLGIF